MTTIQKKDMILHDGEVYVTAIRKPEIGETGILYAKGIMGVGAGYSTFKNDGDGFAKLCAIAEGTKTVVYSTANIKGVPQLNRNHFVKPKEDVWEKAWEYSTYEPAASAFVSGYKANKAEFTREEMEEAIDIAYIIGRNTEELLSKKYVQEDVINSIRPLSIPQYIVIDNDEIVDVKW